MKKCLPCFPSGQWIECVHIQNKSQLGFFFCFFLNERVHGNHMLLNVTLNRRSNCLDSRIHPPSDEFLMVSKSTMMSTWSYRDSQSWYLAHDQELNPKYFVLEQQHTIIAPIGAGTAKTWLIQQLQEAVWNISRPDTRKERRKAVQTSPTLQTDGINNTSCHKQTTWNWDVSAYVFSWCQSESELHNNPTGTFGNSSHLQTPRRNDNMLQ